MNDKLSLNINNSFISFKWILKKSKPVILFIILITTITSVLSLVGVYNTLISKTLIDSAISGNSKNVIKYLIIMIMIMISNLLIQPITSLITTHASTKLNQKIQKDLFQHIQNSNWQSLNKYHSINLLSRVTNDVNTISSTLLSTIPSLISLLFTLVASFSTLIYLAPSIALLAVFIGPFIVIISKIFSKKIKHIYNKAQEEDIKYKSFIQETFQNMMIVKSFTMESFNLDKLSNLQKSLYKISMKNTKLSTLTSTSMNICSTAAYLSIFAWGVLNISTGVTTYGTFTAMLQLYSNIQYPFSSLASLFPKIISALAAAERLIEIENLPLEPISINNDTTLTNPNILFNNISFKYDENTAVLNNLNLNINSGDVIALVGPSGEGKTTLIKVILSLLAPTTGEIYLSEGNKKEKLSTYHRNLISYVPQGNTLFSGTIKDNLRYGNFHATEDEMFSALKDCCAFDFVNNLDNGINTIIGEKSLGISEGQAQRITIARAFLRKKPILILDEATSALDPETEVNILNSIKNLSHKPTCIIITHRPSALNICNRVVRLENGKLIEVYNNPKLVYN